ncbi:MAG: hypothetical protein HZC01_00800 [Candidatus Kerfeldbacteria bacterium]|nr:hypothetical protein [Candidatus Kerfeldbacteria bacterium]
MIISPLQRFILTSAYDAKGRLQRTRLKQFYSSQKKKPSADDQQRIISRSIERLIERGLLIGYGRRTPEKWFIDEVRMTVPGRRYAKKMFNTQQQLPFKP